MMFASTSIYDSMTLFVPQDLLIPNGCFDAYEVKVNKDIFTYISGKGKTNLSIPEIFSFFNGLLEFTSFQ